jgi:hypothetical protein
MMRTSLIARQRTTPSTLAELWLKLKKEGRSGQTAGNRAVKLGEYYVLLKIRCAEIARADREGLCLYREGDRPQEGFQDLALLCSLVASFGLL